MHEKLVIYLNNQAAILDTLCRTIENGAFRESAAHLRNRTIGSLRAIARNLAAKAEELNS